MLFNLSGQELDFIYGKPVISPTNYHFSHFIGQIKGETYLVKINKAKNRVLETYDSSFNLKSSVLIQLDKYQNHDTIIIRNDKLNIIFHVDEKKSKQRHFYIAEITQDGKVNNTQSTLLVKTDIYKSKKQKGHHVSMSKDHNTVIIAARPKLEKNAPEQFDYYTFNKENEQLSKIRIKFHGPPSGFIYHQLHISSKTNNSHLFVEKRTGSKNQPIVQYVLLTINGEDGSYQQEGIDARNTFFQRGKFIELDNRIAYLGYYVDRSKQRITGMYQISKKGDEKTRKIFYNFMDYPPSILKSEINPDQKGSLFFHGQIVRYITTDGKNITVSSESIGKQEVQTVDYYGSYGYGGGYYGGYHGGYYGWGGMGGYNGYGGGYGGVSVSTSSYDILGNIHVITFGSEGEVLENEVVEKNQYTSSPLSGFNIYSNGETQLIGFQKGEYPKTLVKNKDDEYFKTTENIIVNKPTYETEAVFTLKFKPRTTYFIENDRSLFYYQGQKMHAVGELKIK